ncbi:hypothetical protein FRC16_008359 [Serendipita sp. 398]|nr:hypothetical protein FRC16_008359 [Serendipita sp. 398]
MIIDKQQDSKQDDDALTIAEAAGSGSGVESGRSMTNASQETLVDNKNMFKFTHDNPVNTSILSPEGRILYRVSTSFNNDTKTLSVENGTVTVVERSDGGVVAKLLWTELGYDKVGVGNEKPVRLGRVLHSGPFFSETVSFKDAMGRKYEWKGNRAGMTLRLYALDSPGSPVAAFSKSRPDESTGRTQPAYLTILPRGQEILDMVIWGFCFLEKGRRAADNTYGNTYKVVGSV